MKLYVKVKNNIDISVETVPCSFTQHIYVFLLFTFIIYKKIMLVIRFVKQFCHNGCFSTRLDLRNKANYGTWDTLKPHFQLTVRPPTYSIINAEDFRYMRYTQFPPPP